MEHPDSISTAATEDAVEADKVLEIMASKMDATSHLREDYEEFINLHANFEESTSPSSVKFENSTLMTQVIDSEQYVRLDRPDVYRPNLQHITIDITSYERWRRIAAAQGLFTDTQIANFLTQHYENTVNGVPIPPRCISCNTPLSLTCIKCSLLQQTDFTQSADMVLHADVASTDTTPPTVTVVANDSALQHSIHDSGNSILQSGNSVTNGNLLETSIPVVSILQPSSSIADDSMLQTAIPVVNILSSSTSVPNGNTLQGSGPAVSGNSLQQSITISDGSLETLSSSITNSSDIVEEIKNVVLTLPLYECNSNSTASFPSSSLLSTPNSSLSSLTPVLTSSSMPVLNEALHGSSASDKGHLSINKVKKENRLKGKKELSCKECGCQVAHAFPTKASPLKKRKVFRAEKPYKCSECDAAFSHTRNMKAHFWKNHSPSGKRFSCSYCEKTFLNSRDLRTHTYRHTGEMPYKCSYCTAAFTLACNLKTHLRVHTGERPFKCKVCGKAFTESGALKVHTRKHTGEKPFKCSQCEMAFPSSGNLSRHMLTHTGEKPYKCQHCSSAFSQPGSLKTHIRTHTGERPYKCKDCGAAFSDNSTLWKHKRKQSCQGMAPARNKAMTLVQAPPMVPLALLTTTTLPTTVSATPSEENQLPQQMSYRPTALNDAAFVNTINWCFSLPQP